MFRQNRDHARLNVKEGLCVNSYFSSFIDENTNYTLQIVDMTSAISYQDH